MTGSVMAKFHYADFPKSGKSRGSRHSGMRALTSWATEDVCETKNEERRSLSSGVYEFQYARPVTVTLFGNVALGISRMLIVHAVCN